MFSASGSTSDFDIVSAKMRSYHLVEINLKRHVISWIYLLFIPCLIQLCIFWTVIWYKNCFKNKKTLNLYLIPTLIITIIITVKFYFFIAFLINI